MTKLKELEKRLRDEPDNVGLRVTVAGAMREAGRHAEAVELYRSVAVAYRDQGRGQQAIAVCRSLLEIAPDDIRCHALLASLVAGQPGRASRDTAHSMASIDQTPLPRPVPYHLADPTTSLHDKLDFTTQPGERSAPEIEIEAAPYEGEDLSEELETRQRPRIHARDIPALSLPPPTVPITRVDADELDGDDDDDEATRPRDMPIGMRGRAPTQGNLVSRFFAPLPAERRDAVLARFTKRTVTATTTVIRQGESGHPLVIVVRGRLDLRVDRAGGFVQVGSIAAGEYVGEAALLARTPAPAHVIAATDAELLLLAPRDFYELAGAFPALWAELKDTSERRTREHDHKLRGR